MTEKMDIPAHAAGRIDVFAVDLPADAAARLMQRQGGTDDPQAAWPLRAALGADFLDPKGIELVAVKDLAGLGVSGYLAEGLGAEPRGIAANKDRLLALTGQVAILRGVAYGGVAQTLVPHAPLTHIATLHEVAAPPPGPPLTSDSAEPSMPDPEEDETADLSPEGSGTPIPVVIGGLIAAAAIVLALGLVFGG